MSEAGRGMLEEAFAVGPAVGDPARHAGQERRVGRSPEPGNPTHGAPQPTGGYPRTRGRVQSMSTVTRRHGISVPIGGVPLSEHREWYEELAALGYTDVWSSEVNLHDAFTPLALAAAWAPSLRLGTAIVPVYTRGAANLAQTAAALCEAAPGRFVLGIGASSPAVVHDWNGIA